uniref:Uncharacterized protein n=1 Tax=Anguilla anguilla TaxID=7936 RepID=A0A0E9WNB4_ANGAN
MTKCGYLVLVFRNAKMQCQKHVFLFLHSAPLTVAGITHSRAGQRPKEKLNHTHRCTHMHTNLLVPKKPILNNC